MPQPNERTFVVDTLLVNKIAPQVPGGAILVGSLSLPAVGVQVGTTLYSSTNGTTGFVTAANGADKIVDQFLIAAGTLSAGRILRIQSWGIRSATANSVVVKQFLGGTGAVGATISGGTVAGSVTSTTSSGIVTLTSDTLIQVATGNQASFARANPGTTAEIAPVQTAATIDMTAALLINLTMNTTAGTDQTTTGWSISLL